jgi:ABC-type dipeptide/oligopeptide/nickel transport system ATPase component
MHSHKAWTSKGGRSIVLLDDNKTVEEAPPDEFCEHPKHEWTMQFLEQIPWISGERVGIGSGTWLMDARTCDQEPFFS